MINMFKTDNSLRFQLHLFSVFCLFFYLWKTVDTIHICLCFTTLTSPFSVCDILCLPGYQWSDGSPVGFTNWGSGEPNNHQGRENCVEMGIRSNYSYWNDLNCDAVKDWICEIRKGQAPIIPPVPPPDIPGV